MCPGVGLWVMDLVLGESHCVDKGFLYLKGMPVYANFLVGHVFGQFYHRNRQKDLSNLHFIV